MNRWIQQVQLFIIACSAIICGCNGTPNDGYNGPKGKVTGVVTVEGRPVPKGTQILFQAPQTGYTATGEIGENGAYTLIFQEKDLIPAVEYQVQLTPPPPESVPESEAPATGPPPIIKSPAAFPQRYLSITTSEIMQTVKEGDNKIDITLLSK